MKHDGKAQRQISSPSDSTKKITPAKQILKENSSKVAKTPKKVTPKAKPFASKQKVKKPDFDKSEIAEDIDPTQNHTQADTVKSLDTQKAEVPKKIPDVSTEKKKPSFSKPKTNSGTAKKPTFGVPKKKSSDTVECPGKNVRVYL